jgi:hypothetical protein
MTKKSLQIAQKYLYNPIVAGPTLVGAARMSIECRMECQILNNELTATVPLHAAPCSDPEPMDDPQSNQEIDLESEDLNRTFIE